MADLEDIRQRVIPLISDGGEGVATRLQKVSAEPVVDERRGV